MGYESKQWLGIVLLFVFIGGIVLAQILVQRSNARRARGLTGKQPPAAGPRPPAES